MRQVGRVRADARGFDPEGGGRTCSERRGEEGDGGPLM